jgi:hypothetical protein
MAGRAKILAAMADKFMAAGCLPASLPAGCSGFRVQLHPEPPAEPREVHFSAAWPGITLVCRRPLGGLCRPGAI